MWTLIGEAKVDRPMPSWKENPAAMISAKTIAHFRKKRSSPVDGYAWSCASVAMVAPLLTSAT